MDLKEAVLESGGSESYFTVVGCCEYGNEPSAFTDVGDPFTLGMMRWESVISLESADSLGTPGATRMSVMLG
jgi:hypothetical protein